NTNEASVREGYNSERRNAFIYLLESGSVWHQPIERGNFYIQLMDGLSPKDVQGLSSGFGFGYNEAYQLYAGAKTHFSPTRKDNLVATYYAHNENFSFETIVTQFESLFTEIDELSHLPLEILSYTEVKIGDPYEVKSTFLGYLPILLSLFVISAPFIIGFIVVAIITWAIVKWTKIRKRTPKK